jgi:hypothetical protein
MHSSYTVSSQDSIDNLSDNVEQLRLKLQSEMATLRPRLGSFDGTDEIVGQRNHGSVARLIYLASKFYQFRCSRGFIRIYKQALPYSTASQQFMDRAEGIIRRP